ncbi:MAG: HD domain-containing protein [Patescibacteria group bacterium]
MTVNEIYTKYRTPNNLQQHMLRVAALCTVIVSSWKGEPISKEDIVNTLLFHDIAKPVTFDIANQARFVSSPEELVRLEQDIKYLVDNFGSEEHQAALKIFQDIGLNKNCQRLINNLEWHNTDDLMRVNDIESLLTIYCDMRIGPKGVLLIEQRLSELNARNPIEDFEKRLKSAKDLENLIIGKVPIKLDEIKEEQISPIAEMLSQKQFN